ncbi:hypothetical protein KXR87_17160 [Yokenella regensburgei]|uniref:hypothetical protein n=1 Tax=Yokenella regensburgei TaxID=158877 RepID=UPI003F16EABA
MISDDENKLGYISIGDAVLENIQNDAELSCESLIETLIRQEKEATNHVHRTQILQGRALLSGSATFIN